MEKSLKWVYLIQFHKSIFSTGAQQNGEIFEMVLPNQFLLSSKISRLRSKGRLKKITPCFVKLSHKSVFSTGAQRNGEIFEIGLPNSAP